MFEFYDFYNDKPHTYADFESTSLSPAELGRVRFNWTDGNGKYMQVYPGRILFESRNTGPKKTRTVCSPSSMLSWGIDFSSQIDNRRAYLIALIDAFLDGTENRNSVLNQGIFLDYADNHFDRKRLFFDEQLLKKAYQDYSLKLWDRVSQSNLKKPFSRRTASMYQRAAVKAILLIRPSLEERTVESWALKILQRRGENGFKVLGSTKAAARCRDAHRYLFNRISEYLLQDKPEKPFVLEEEDKLDIVRQIYVSANVFNLHELNQNIASYYQRSNENDLGSSRRYELLFDQNGKLRNSLEEAIAQIDLQIERNGPFSDSKINRRTRSYYRALARGDYPSEINEGTYFRDLFNIASVHFTHYILADSGANLSVVRSTPHMVPEYLEREDKYRILSFKKKGDKEFSLRMSPLAEKYWKRYIALCEKFIHSKNTLRGPQYFKNRSVEAVTITSNNLAYPTKFWNSDHAWINTKDWRDHSINLSLTATDDIRYTANQHQHQIETTRKHYIAVEKRVAVKELNEYFSGLANAVKLYKDKRVDVNIVESDGGVQGLTGTCTSKGDAEADNGFSDDVPQPRCSAMLSCFFCKSYALRAVTEDILMLLSIKEWLPMHSRANSLNMDEHLLKFQPILERVDDIIAVFQEKGEEYKSLVIKAQNQIEIGNLHPYWEMKIAALDVITDDIEGW